MVNPDQSVTVTAADGAAVRFWAQPIDSNHSAIRGIANLAPEDAARIALLRYHSALLNALRDRIEARDAHTPATPLLQPVIAQVADDLVDIPSVNKNARTADLRVQVARKEISTTGIARLRFEPIRGQLPTFQPGAHIDLHLQNGLIRQYSLTNGPGETDHYIIGVKREPQSTAGPRRSMIR